MANRRDVKMPKDWNDHAGWDAHYESRTARSTRDPWREETGTIGVGQLPGLVEDLKQRGWRTLWIPGCGLSPLARMLAHLGLEVVATDVSAVAIQFQRKPQGDPAHLAERFGPADPAGSFEAEQHDFRDAFRRDAFDMIINVKAFQAFPPADMARIAAVHADALRKGRTAYFDTMNVQGERRDQLEQALEDGGFMVPLRALNAWYRRALRATRIPHLFVLGRPMIPRTGAYASDDAKRDRDTARLREIDAEYRTRLQSEAKAEEQRIGPDARIASVIYSTG